MTVEYPSFNGAMQFWSNGTKWSHRNNETVKSTGDDVIELISPTEKVSFADPYADPYGMEDLWNTFNDVFQQMFREESCASSEASYKPYTVSGANETFLNEEWFLARLEESDVSICYHVHTLDEVSSSVYDSSDMVLIYDGSYLDSYQNHNSPGTFMVLYRGNYYRDESGLYGSDMTDREFREYLAKLLMDISNAGVVIEETSLSFAVVPWYSDSAGDFEPHVSLLPFQKVNPLYLFS